MIRRFLFAALLPTTMFAACSDDPGVITPSGPHYHYAVNKAFIPKNSTEARMFGLDVDGKSGVDNQLGMVLGTLATQGFDIQGSIDSAILEGTINLLVNVQTADFASSSAAGVAVHLGDMPTPAPCTDPQNPTPATCGKHLDGNGMFTLSDSSPDAALPGTIKNGVFSGGPGNIKLQISLAGATVELNLIGARAQVSGMSEMKIDSAIVAGAVTKEELDGNVIPAIASQLGPLIKEDCNDKSEGGDPNATPACGCEDGSTGKQIQGLFDTMPKDCEVTVDEIKNNGLIMSLLAPDVMIDGKSALSIGLKTSAIKATYTVPGEE